MVFLDLMWTKKQMDIFLLNLSADLDSQSYSSDFFPQQVLLFLLDLEDETWEDVCGPLPSIWKVSESSMS